MFVGTEILFACLLVCLFACRVGLFGTGVGEGVGGVVVGEGVGGTGTGVGAGVTTGVGAGVTTLPIVTDAKAGLAERLMALTVIWRGGPSVPE